MLGPGSRGGESEVPVWRPEKLDHPVSTGAAGLSASKRLESLLEELKTNYKELQQVEKALEQRRNDPFLLKKYERHCKREERLLSERATWAGISLQNSNWEALQAAPGVKALLSRLVTPPAALPAVRAQSTVPGVWTPTPKATTGKAVQNESREARHSKGAGKTQRQPQQQLMMLANAADFAGSSGVRFVSPSQNAAQDSTVKARQYRMAKRRIDRLTTRGSGGRLPPAKRHNSSKAAPQQPRDSTAEAVEELSRFGREDRLASEEAAEEAAEEAVEDAVAQPGTSGQAESGSGTHSDREPSNGPVLADNALGLASSPMPPAVEAAETPEVGDSAQDAPEEAAQPLLSHRGSGVVSIEEQRDGSGARESAAGEASDSAPLVVGGKGIEQDGHTAVTKPAILDGGNATELNPSRIEV